MLDETTRATILRLREQGHGSRGIARALGISRGAVKGVLRNGSSEVPRIVRAEQGLPLREEILDLYMRCKGNLVRVHEELLVGGATLSYPGLTAFCRRHGIGHEPPAPAGRYHFDPGQEMQHDTSPHDVKLSGKARRVQTTSIVLCHSRMLFIQLYPTFNRFLCKLFLTDALRYFGGACGVCMIDNTHVVVLRGTGKEMVPVPEMVAFGDRFGFRFLAHEKGDANRSARVERPFDYIENNFLAGREFTDWDHANREAIAWCDKVNAKPKKHLHASPRELFAAERVRLKPLPAFVPEVYLLHQRIVDVEGYVCVHTNRYSAPYRLIGRSVEVRETKERIEIFEGPRRVASHRRLIDPVDARVLVPEHRPPRGELAAAARRPTADEQALLDAAPELAEYVAALKKRADGRKTTSMRRLARMLQEYPREPFLEAVRTATQYGLFDLERLERMVLRGIGKNYFRLPPGTDEDDPDDGAGT